jgi:ABC-2 type transport system permease protein/oleandomycin transport system permease protein
MGRTIAELARNTFVVAIMFAVGLLVGFRPEGSLPALAAALGLLLLFSFALSWIFVVNGLAVRTVEAVQQSSFLWLFPLTFVSSAFVPTDSMPGWLQVFAENQPVTIVVNAVRDLTLGTNIYGAGLVAVLWSVGILVVAFPAALWLYNRRTTQ